VPTGDIRWLCSDDRFEPETVVRIVESCKSQKVVQGLGMASLAHWHRETLGAGTGRAEDDVWFERGMYPGLAGRIYSLSKNGAGELRVRAQASTEYSNRYQKQVWRPTGVPSSETPVDVVGILDVYILKGWRLFQRPLNASLNDVWYDELAVALDRAGFVAYIAVSCKRLPAELTELGEYYLIDWIRRNGPPPSRR
jgi:hypothetical protein